MAQQESTDLKPLSGRNAATLNGEQLSLDGWSANSNITLDIDTNDFKFGDGSISATTSASGKYDRIEYRFPSQPGVSYKVSLWAKKEVGSTQALTQWEGVETFEVQRIDTDFWKRYTQTVVATESEIVIRAYASIAGEIGDDIYIDGLTIISHDELEALVSEPPAIADRSVDTGLANLIVQNPNFDGTAGWQVETRGHLYSTESHTADGSGSVELVTHLNELASPAFACESGQRYVLSAYMKVTSFPKGQGVRIQVHGGSSSWNASTEGEWEEILIPFIPPRTHNGICHVYIGTSNRSHSTTYVEYPNRPELEVIPEQVRDDGSNLDRTARVFIDDVKVVRSDEIKPRETIITKNHYESPYVRIDDLGNFTVKRNDEWVSIFPKMISYSRHGDGPSATENLYQRSLRYVEYGFNGLMGVFALERDVIRPLEAGIEYVAVSGSTPFRRDGNDSIKRLIPELKNHLDLVGKPEAFLWYYYDNENTWRQFREHKEKLTQIIAELDTDPDTLKRQHPLFMLNGTYGLARSYLNESSELMDFTGAYSTLGNAGQLLDEPTETLGVIDKSHNQRAPSPMIQLQCYHHEQFVPALFFGIIQGGKALSMWRDGTEYQPRDGEPCKLNFEDNVWASAVKGGDGVFARLDNMLPLIREPHWTRWSASSSQKNIRIGTRDYAGDHYIILSNHSNQPIAANVFIDGIEITGAEDYFTGEFINSSSNGTVNIPVGHHNDGYRVVKLIQAFD